MIVAAEGARFALPEVKRGLMTGAGGVHRVARVLPRNIAIQMVTTGEPIEAETAAAFGMVNRVVPAADLLDTALDLARQIAANAPIAVAESLALTRRAGDLGDAELRRLSRERMRYVNGTADAQEGPRAFVEKRAPVWQRH